MDTSSAPAASAKPVAADGIKNLDNRQLEGLKFLGEIGARLAEGWQPEFAQPLTHAVHNAGCLYERHDLPNLLEETLATLTVLRNSGLLAGIRDNAVFIAESMHQLQALLPPVLQWSQQISWETLRQQMAAFQHVVDTLQAINEFYQQNLAAGVTEGLVELGGVWQQTGLDAALLDAARTLGALHRDGTFKRLRDVSSLLSGVMQNSDLDELTAGTIKQLEGMRGLAQIPALLQMLNELAQAWQQSATEIAEPDAPKGGLVGLVKLLRDPVVQEFLQRIIVTAQHMEHPASPARNGAVQH
ncbi:MAG: hypothetical protein ACYC3O_04865 [Burkholderiales bacterium]